MLSTTAEHALRAMICLSRNAPAAPILARDLSDCAQVPMSYLSKILAALTRAGILHAARGINGGYRLARPAAEVALVDIVELFDGPQQGRACLLGTLHACSDDDPCPAHESWKGARDAYLAFLRETTLANLAAPLPWRRAPAARDRSRR